MEPGKIPHEVFHLTMKKLFDNNPELMNRFKATIESSFPGKIFSDVEIRDKDGKREMKFPNHGNLLKFIFRAFSLMKDNFIAILE